MTQATDGLLAIDQGTTSSRAMVFDTHGNVISCAQREHTQHYPQAGWVEHDADEIWLHTRAVTRDALAQAHEKGCTPLALGITNQRETIVAWRKDTGETLHNALVWQDKRTTDACDALRPKHGDTVRAKTGLPLDPYFSASKMQWLLTHVPEVARAADEDQLAFGTIDSFLLWRLTQGGVHATDITNACRTLLYNIHTCMWDEDLLALFNIPASALPDVHPTAHMFGTTAAGVLPISLPICALVGDQQAATIGQACFEEGMLKSTYGTGCFAMLNTGTTPHTSEHGLLTTVAYQFGDTVTYALEGSIFVAGSAVQWLRDKAGLIHHAAETEELARTAREHDDVYMVPAFAGLGAPYWDAHAKGAFVGLTLDADKNVLVRATLEAMAYQTHDLTKAMAADMGRAIQSLRVDGGMVGNTWLMQRMADLLNIPLERPHVHETTALGAAFAAGLQCGVYRCVNDIAACWQHETIFTPNMDETYRTCKLKGWAQAVDAVRHLHMTR